MNEDAAGGRRRRIALAAAMLILVLATWQIAHLLAGDNRAGESMVPGIVDVADAVKGMSREWPGGLGVERTDEGGEETWLGAVLAFGYHSTVTGARMLAGYVIGVAAGVSLAALVSWSPVLRRLVHLPAHTTRMLPLLALIPLFALWFGNSDTGAILFVAFTVFVYAFAFGVNAIANVATYYRDFARSLGASQVRTYVQVVLPAALPELGSGLSLSLALGWSAAISAEFNGQQAGLGKIAFTAQYFTQTGTLAMIALTIIAFAALSFLIARRAVNWASRWSE